MKTVKNQIKKYTSEERKNFLAFIKEKDPDLYHVAIEKGWLDRILDEIGFGPKNPAQANTTTN